MPSDFKGVAYRNTNFTGDKEHPFRSKGYQIHEMTNESARRPGSTYARPMLQHLYDDQGRKILTMDLSKSTITVGNKIVYNGQKILFHGQVLSLKQLRAEAARWCWAYLKYIPEELIPGRKMSDKDYSIILDVLFK